VIGDLKPYADYKDSGLPWLGQVPAHWQIVRSKRLFSARKDLAKPDDPQLSATQAYGVIEQAEFERRSGHRVVKISMHLDKRKHVEKDDFVISMRSFQGGIERAWSSGAIRSSYVVLKPGPEVNASYFQYALKSAGYIRALQATGDFIRDGQDLSFANFVRVDLPSIPTAEQAAIGRFLNWACDRLESTIRAKRRVISLLAEQKRAVIRSAVTRGLDDSVPLKHSGVDWLGNFPAHWEVLSLKRVLRRLIDCEHKTAPKVDESAFRVVRTTAVRNGELRISGTYCTTPTAYRSWTRRGVPEVGDVIFTREAPAGEACLVPEAMRICLGQRTVLMKPNRQRLDAQYLVHTIYAGPPRVAITLASQGSTVSHFNMSDIGLLPLLLPPIEEQREIVKSIVEQTAGLTTTITRLEREIDLLREYRTRLISDIVTGKFDVRDAAARLPAEVPVETVVDLDNESYEVEPFNEEAAEA